MPEGNNPNMQMTKRERNAANNANTIKNAAEVASKTNNPYAKAIGEGIKAADKMSGGKTTEMLGKQMERANRLSGPAGRKLQKASNRLSESGMGDRIGDAARKSGNPAQGGIGNKPNDKGKSMSGNIPNLESGTQNETKNDVEDTADAGDSSFKLSNKVVKIGLIACACIFPIIIICVCFIGASQTYITAIDLGTADSLTNSEVEDKINKKQDDESEDLDEEIKDDHENLAFDINLNNSKLNLFRNSKLNVLTVQRTSQTYLRRKYNEASIDLIEDFYPTVSDYSKTYDENLVYDFFYKMYKLNESYKTNYNVDLDLPLLMATLNLQSQDKNVIFTSNLGDLYRTDNVKDMPLDELDYYYDWSSYKTSKNNSEHDMEILAQNMVSEKTGEECTKPAQDGKCYAIDNAKYKEFLKQFLEKKYYLEGEYDFEDSGNEDFDSQPATGDFRKWTQCGQSWSSIVVPNSNKTMCQIGCLITSISIQIARSGTAIVTEAINPGIAVKKFNFAAGGNLYWHSPSNLAPNFHYYANISLIGMNKKAIVDKLTSYDPSRYYIILGVGKISRNELHHFVAFDYADKSNNKIYIMDPAGIQYSDLYERYRLYEAHIYEKKD